LRTLILILRAAFLAGIPGYGASLGNRNAIYNPSHITGCLFICVNGHFNDLDRQLSAFGGSSQGCTDTNFVPVFSLGTKLSGDIEMDTRPTNFAPLQLAAWPTLAGPIACTELDRVKGVSCIKINHSNFDGRPVANEGTSGNLSFIDSGDIGSTLSINRVPAAFHTPRPKTSNIVQINTPMFSLLDGVEGVSGQAGIVPNDSAGISPSGVANAGKYELVAECRNLAVRVVWDSGFLIYGQTVSSHYSLIFREIENDNRPRNDLGMCRIRYKDHQKTFSHVALSSGAPALFGFKVDHSGEKAPTCLGCTLIVSRDGRHWYEVLAGQ
jgi:hypothetical protein